MDSSKRELKNNERHPYTSNRCYVLGAECSCYLLSYIGVIVIEIIVYGFISCCVALFFAARNRNNVYRCESYIEKRLVRVLLSRGYNVRTQVRCGPYRIDVTIGDIAIECDGFLYHSSPAQKRYDKRRTSYLYRHGYQSVLRFSGAEINNNPYSCVERIEGKLLRNKKEG